MHGPLNVKFVRWLHDNGGNRLLRNFDALLPD